jgi:hypothetical protein
MKKTRLLIRFFGSCFLMMMASGLFVIPGFGQTPVETILFSSTDASQWNVDGRVTFQSSDTTLRLIFDFDADHPPKVRPDTTILEIVPDVNTSGYDSVFVFYTTLDYLPGEDSWIVGTVKVYAKHEYQSEWTEVFEDLTSVAGSAQHLRIKLKVAVRSDTKAPGSFAIDNFMIIGKKY